MLDRKRKRGVIFICDKTSLFPLPPQRGGSPRPRTHVYYERARRFLLQSLSGLHTAMRRKPCVVGMILSWLYACHASNTTVLRRAAGFKNTELNKHDVRKNVSTCLSSPSPVVPTTYLQGKRACLPTYTGSRFLVLCHNEYGSVAVFILQFLGFRRPLITTLAACAPAADHRRKHNITRGYVYRPPYSSASTRRPRLQPTTTPHITRAFSSFDA